MQRFAVIWRALKNRKLTDILRDFGNHLYGRRTRANYPDPLVTEINRFPWPVGRMPGGAFEFSDILKVRGIGFRKNTCRLQQKTCRRALASFGFDRPKTHLAMVSSRAHASIELHFPF